MKSLSWRLTLLAALGCVSMVVYELLDGIVPRLALAEPSGVWQIIPWTTRTASGADIPTDLVEISTVAGWFSLAVAVLFGCYLGALLTLRHAAGASLAVAVFTFGVMFQVQQLDAPALLSSDPFSYLMYGRIASVHHGNPYEDGPSSYADDPVLPHVYWREVPSFYGPVWTEVSAAIASLAGNSIPSGVLLFRTVAAAAAVGCGALIWLVLRPQGSTTATVGAALWLWNPLVPLEAGMSGHNDLLLMFLLLAAVLCAQRHKLLLCGACWAGAVFVKAVAALVLPIVALLWLFGDKTPLALGKWAVWAGAGVVAVMLGLVVVGRSPKEGTGVGVLGADTERYTNSVHELLLAQTRLLMGDSPNDVRTPLYFRAHLAHLNEATGLWSSSADSRRLLVALPAQSSLLVVAPAENGLTRVFDPFAEQVGYVPTFRLSSESAVDELSAEAARSAWMSRSHLADANALIRAAAYGTFTVGLTVITIQLLQGMHWANAMTWLFLAFLLTTATWIWPWYILWALGFAALSPSSRAVRLTLFLTASSLLIYPLFGYQGTGMWWGFNYRALVVWVLPLIVWWASEGVPWSWSRRRGVPKSAPSAVLSDRSVANFRGDARKRTRLA